MTQQISLTFNESNTLAYDITKRWKKNGINVSDKIAKLVIQEHERQKRMQEEVVEQEEEGGLNHNVD